MSAGRRGRTRREFLQAGAAALWLAADRRLLGQSGASQPGGADWPRFGYDIRNTRFNARETRLGVDNVGRLKLKWSRTIGAPIQSTPTVVGDTLYIGAWNGCYHALDVETGEPRWTFDAANGICATDAHVRVAVGLDYLGAAPVRGSRYGGEGEALEVAVSVNQPMRQSQS